MADTADLIARLLARRERWVELEPGRRLRIRRPAEADIGAFVRSVDADKLGQAVVGWEGFVESDALGESQGSNSALPFDQALCIELLRDRVDWMETLVDAVLASIREHVEAREAARGN